MVALVTLLSLSTVTLAADPTTTTVTWTGTGLVTGIVNAGNDNSTTFTVNAGNATGTFTATDSNDNPYSYGVDSVNAYFDGSFYGGGSMQFQTNRTDSYSGMYGTSGQVITNFVGSTGSGQMATGSSTNYAAMVNGTYNQPHTDGGYNFEASGLSYQIMQTITAPTAFAGLNIIGDGTAVVNSMTTQASGTNNADLGWGGGCYTNANAVMTGEGTVTVQGTGSNSVSTPIAGANGVLVSGGWVVNGNGTEDSANLQTIANFTNGASVGNFSIKVR